MDDVLVVMCNVPDEAMAERIARTLVEQRLAACVNLLPAIKSVYQWQGKIEAAQEITLVAKTVAPRYPELEAAIRQLHPYDVPEIIAVPVVAGHRPYLDWVADETRKEVRT